MSVFDDMVVEETTEKKEEKPKKKAKKSKPVKSEELTDEMIKLVQNGGETIDDEVKRPFWKFPTIVYPYEHFIPSFMMILGRKGSGKTTLGFSVPGNILGITFEKRGNITKPWTKLFRCNPRFQLFGVSEYISRGSTTAYRDRSNTIYTKVINLLSRAIALKDKFDWVMIDGLQRTQKVTTQRMLALNQLGAFDNVPTKYLRKWGERTMYLENLVIDLASFASKKGVIITSQDEVHQAMFLTKEQEASGMKLEDIPIKEPAWKEGVRDDVDTVIYTDIAEKVLGPGRSQIIRYATVSTNKNGGGEGKHNITLQIDSEATKKLMELLLTSEPDFYVE